MTSTDQRVVVRRFAAKQWVVICPACGGDPVLSFFSPPWITATTDKAARILAVWHVELHRDTMCDCCGHTPPVARPEVLPHGLLVHGEAVYALGPAGVHALGRPRKVAS